MTEAIAHLNIRRAATSEQRLVAGLVELHRQAFRPQMQYADAYDYFRQALDAPSHLNIVAETRQGVPVGYLLGIPQNEVAAELRRWDPLMTDDPGAIYLDTIQILPAWRGRNISLELIARLCAEAEKRGVRRLTMHARAATGWNERQQNIFASVRTLRRIENWFGSGEPFDYLEATTALRSDPEQRSQR